MRYLLMTREDQNALLERLSAMPELLETAFGSLSAEEARAGDRVGLSPVEQCWHLADLEREGYAVRIERLRTEIDPELPDFDGTRIARERNYKSLSLADGLNAFTRARADNVTALRQLSAAEWQRRGRQEGVGSIGLCDVPAMMAEHDRAHRDEIEEWVQKNR
jgi:hypothetical protein